MLDQRFQSFEEACSWARERARTGGISVSVVREGESWAVIALASAARDVLESGRVDGPASKPPDGGHSAPVGAQERSGERAGRRSSAAHALRVGRKDSSGQVSNSAASPIPEPRHTSPSQAPAVARSQPRRGAAPQLYCQTCGDRCALTTGEAQRLFGCDERLLALQGAEHIDRRLRRTSCRICGAAPMKLYLPQISPAASRRDAARGRSSNSARLEERPREIPSTPDEGQGIPRKPQSPPVERITGSGRRVIGELMRSTGETPTSANIPEREPGTPGARWFTDDDWRKLRANQWQDLRKR